LSSGADTPGKILIRADATSEIGTGHVMRCLALAQAWQDAGGKAVFLMANCTPSISSRLAAENCEVISISADAGSAEDADLTNFHALRCQAEWLVLDGYRFTPSYTKQVWSDQRNLLLIDDGREPGAWAADLILNQNLTASEDSYREHSPGAQLLLGSDYCLLRREFAPWREWQRKIPALGDKVLMTLGGSTPAETGEQVMESLSRVSVQNLRAVFVIGGSSSDVESLQACATKFHNKIEIRRDVSNMASLMAEADIAISAAGSTCWELCLLGLPPVLLDLADNQTPVALALQRQGCAIYGGSASAICVNDLAAVTETLLASQQSRQSMSCRLRQLVDGLGAERVTSRMLAIAREPILAVKGERD
jgi:UDP-2,4-diacetamido-2,4,6-trideoxy-beta-L-altropyranose hydrolase